MTEPQASESAKSRSQGRRERAGLAPQPTSRHGRPQDSHGRCTKTRTSCSCKKQGYRKGRSEEKKARPQNGKKRRIRSGSGLDQEGPEPWRSRGDG
eukprot:15453464-Heterocapsa_arctica.AAC.1